MRSLWRIAGFAGHLLLVAAAVVAMQVATSDFAYPPLRIALVAMVVVLSAVTLFGRFPLGLGPVAGSATAWIVRMVGITLAGAGAAGVAFGLAQGGSLSERAGGVPLVTVVLAVYLGAFLAVSRRDGGLPQRAMLTGVGLGLLAGALFAAAVPILPPGLMGLPLLLAVAAPALAGWLTRPAEIGVLSALLATVTACQTVFFAAAVLYQYGPDAWMPYAGPGPLTPQGQLEQNRAEAIDPYVAVLFLGAVAATVLVAMALTARLRARTEASVPRSEGRAGAPLTG